MPVLVIRVILGFHLETETELVAGLVQLGAVNVAGQSHGDPVPQLLLVAHSDLRNSICSGLLQDNLCSHYLAVGVDLSPDAGVLVQSKLAADGEVGSSSDGAGAGHSSLQLGTVLQVDSSTEGLQKMNTLRHRELNTK